MEKTDGLATISAMLPEIVCKRVANRNLSREELILTKHFFEHNDIQAACVAAGYEKNAASQLKNLFHHPGNRFYEFYQELCRDRIASTVITAEKKRCKLWDLVEWSTTVATDGRPNNSKLALACIDMLNRMDGHYAPVRVDSKQQMQIQKQSVTFQQQIDQVDKKSTADAVNFIANEID